MQDPIHMSNPEPRPNAEISGVLSDRVAGLGVLLIAALIGIPLIAAASCACWALAGLAWCWMLTAWHLG